MAADDHPNKEIRAAVDYARSRGWRVIKSGPVPTFRDNCFALKPPATDAFSASSAPRAAPRITPSVCDVKSTAVHTPQNKDAV